MIEKVRILFLSLLEIEKLFFFNSKQKFILEKYNTMEMIGQLVRVLVIRKKPDNSCVILTLTKPLY